MAHHGMAEQRGMDLFCTRESVQEPIEGRFGRMFPDLPPLYVDPGALAELGRQGGPMDGGSSTRATRSVPLGLVFLGQFVDHDITLDVTSSLDRVNDPFATENFRTPALDLDCLYGSGPDASPWLYHASGVFAGVKLLAGADGICLPAGTRKPDLVGLQKLADEDLARNVAGTALIGDPRNDENRILSQLHLAFVRFHNAVVDRLHATRRDERLEGPDLFEAARDEVRWHTQWIVVFEFLPAMVGRALVDDVLACGRRHYRPCHAPFIPIEFAAAAYRYGHSMVAQKLRTQPRGRLYEILSSELGPGFTPLADLKHVVSWPLFFDFPRRPKAQRAAPLDTLLAGDLLALPFVKTGEKSLATRNLLRAQSFRLPSGEKVAEAMGLADDPAHRRLHRSLARLGLGDGTPLWYYVLAEAEQVGRGGVAADRREGLGPVGGRIVAEVLIGLLEADDTSILGENRNWRPNLGRHPGRFAMSDLLSFQA